MDREELKKARHDAYAAVRQADRALWSFGTLTEHLFEKLELVMATGLPSEERREQITQTFDEYIAQIGEYEKAMRSVGTQVKDFVVANQDKKIDPDYLVLLKNILDTCDAVINKPKIAEAKHDGDLPE